MNKNKLDWYNRVINLCELKELDEVMRNEDLVEDGHNLSGGQIQRIGLARALYNNPPILVLDEFTSALDTKTEDNIISNFHKYLPNSTMVMIAHRKETIEKCDEVWKIQDGRLIKL